MKQNQKNRDPGIVRCQRNIFLKRSKIKMNIFFKLYCENQFDKNQFLAMTYDLTESNGMFSDNDFFIHSEKYS